MVEIALSVGYRTPDTYLYRNRLPASGEEMRDFPIYCQRLFLGSPEPRTAAELFLPLR